MAYKYGNTINSRWRSYASYTISTTATQVKIEVSAGFQNVNSYNYRSYNCSGYITDGNTRYNGSSSDIGGNSAGVRDQLISSKTYTYNRTTSSYSKTITFSLSCTGGTIAPGTSKSTLSVSVPAKTKYTVSYNANGGTGMIANQYKYYGDTITLSIGTGLSRENYTFIGWNTEADGTGTDYSAGASYSINASLTLYARWKLTYIKPSISNAKAYRVKSGGTPDMQGENIYVSFNYKGGSIDGGSTYIKPTCVIKINDIAQYSGELPNTTGIHVATYGTYSVNDTHKVSIWLFDSEGERIRTLHIGSLVTPIDTLGDSEENKVYVGIGGVAISGCDIALHGEDIRMSLNTNSGAGADGEIYSALQTLGWTDLII
ncbi:MAG: InlB B-repeat-containing protein [Fastidiosipila sp.]|nr:InlB B-repeat-containing protein [Fastidiosipila sp.]